MKAALIGAVDFNESDFVSRSFDLVIAIDRGLQTCQDAGITPGLVVGDFDSLGFVPEAAEVREYPHVKNESDLELACVEAAKRGAGEMCIYGALSNRLDHTLATLQVMASVVKQGIKVVGIGSDFAVVALSANADQNTLCFDAFNPNKLTGNYAPYISLMAFAGPVRGLFLEGLAYTTQNLTLHADVSRGLSNEFMGQAASIQFEEGVLIAIFPLDALAYASF